jgi:hypothetical protein
MKEFFKEFIVFFCGVIACGLLFQPRLQTMESKINVMDTIVAGTPAARKASVLDRKIISEKLDKLTLKFDSILNHERIQVRTIPNR